MKTALTVDRELGRVLADANVEGRSGLLTAVRGKLKRIFCVQHGALAFATSNVIEEQLSAYLARTEQASPKSLVEATAACRPESAAPLSRYLLEHYLLAPEDLERVLQARLRELLFATLEWNSGHVELAAGRPNLGNEVTVAMSPIRLLLDYAVDRPASIGDVQMRVGPPNARMVLAPDAEARLAGLDTDGLQKNVLQLCSEGCPTSRVADRPGADGAAAWRALYGLTLAGVVVARTAARATEKDPDQVSREEMLARLERAGGDDYYAVLELGRTATREQIRDAYYFLARRYHPDRFRSGLLSDMLPRIEPYFANVTEAYNTLYDPDLRAAYDELRASDAPSKESEQESTAYLARQNFARARVLLDKGRFTDAVVALRNAVSQDETQAAYQLELGKLLARNPRHRKEAEHYLVQTNKVDPALADGYLALGDLYAKTKRREDAERLYNEVLRWEPGHLEATERLRALSKGDDGGLLRGLFGGGS